MYVRFVINEIDDKHRRRARDHPSDVRLWHSGALSAHEEAWWADIRSWLNLDLDEPDRLARSRRPGAHACAISWFKASAADHITRAREVCALLAQHDISTKMLIAERPGYVVYEDEFQVAAEPFRSELA